MPKTIRTPQTESRAQSEPTVSFTIQVATDLAFIVGENGEKVAVPVEKLSPEHIQHVWLYGAGRFTRDGTTKVREKVKGDDGKEKTVERDATTQERLDLAAAKWARLIDGTFKTRAIGPRDYFTGIARTMVVKALIARKVDRKKIPKLTDRSDMEKALAAFPGVWEKVTALAEEQAERQRKADAELATLEI